MQPFQLLNASSCVDVSYVCNSTATFSVCTVTSCILPVPVFFLPHTARVLLLYSLCSISSIFTTAFSLVYPYFGMGFLLYSQHVLTYMISPVQCSSLVCLQFLGTSFVTLVQYNLTASLCCTTRLCFLLCVTLVLPM